MITTTTTTTICTVCHGHVMYCRARPVTGLSRLATGISCPAFRTCVAAERAVELLEGIAGDVQGPPETLKSETRHFSIGKEVLVSSTT